MCSRDAVRVLTFGASSFVDSGPNIFEQERDALGLGMPDFPSAPTPVTPPDPPNPGAEDLWAPKGQKDAQALAARLGTNALVVPFQSTNIV